MLKSCGLGIALGFLLGIVTPIVKADYVYEGNQDLYDLQTNSSGSTGLGSNDDSVSSAFDLGFTFTFYGQDFTQARMATNGCLHFILTGSYCGDYTPDPLPEITYTLYPFWTDLIKDGGSAMRAKAFNDYTIFGWYNMREYNRANSDNSLEVWLYPNDTYEFRYGELDIIQHDVLIGEQGTTSQLYTYHFFDECSTGTTNVSGTCVNYDWNSSSNAKNTLLEDGGSLYGDGTNQSLCATVPLTSANCAGYVVAYFNQQCGLSALYDEDCTGYATAYLAQQCGLSALYDSSCSGYAIAYLSQQCGLNTLYDSSCEGYAAAYLTQQCGLNDLYDNACPNYDTAYHIQQCDEDTQYSPTCNGYVQDLAVIYYSDDTTDYGYDNSANIDMFFTDAEWYEIDIQEFGQEQVDEWYGEDATFDSSGTYVFEEFDYSDTYEVYEDDYYVEDIYLDDTFYYEDPFLVSYDEFEVDTLTFNPNQELIDEFIFYETVLIADYEAVDTYIEFESVEELDEWYEEELAQMEEEEIEEELLAEIEEEIIEETEEEIFEEEVVEEIYEELEEERIAEAEAEEIIETEETELLIAEEPEEKKGGITATQLNVVANSIRAASNSVAGTTAGATASSGGWGSTGSSSRTSGYRGSSGISASVGNTTTSAVASSASGGGISTSSSPSISDQIQTAQIQTNTILSLNQDMGSTRGMGGSTQTVSNVTTIITPMPTFDSTPQIVMADVQVTDMQGEIDTAVSGVMTASEADQIADKIIANNIKEQQEEAEATQEETGEYSDESALVAFMGYVVGFDAYRQAHIPKAETWYESRVIYGDSYISDNIDAFYGLARTSINTMQSLINSQPNL